MIRQRGKTSGEVRASAGKDPATGKEQCATKTVRGTEKWFTQAEPDRSPSVAPQYQTLLDNRILPRWGDTPLRQLRTADLDLWYSELVRDGRLDGKGGLSDNSTV